MLDGIKLVGQVGQVTFVLKPLKEVANEFGYSTSYIKRLCQEEKLISTKYNQQWFVEEHLTVLKSFKTLSE